MAPVKDNSAEIEALILKVRSAGKNNGLKGYSNTKGLRKALNSAKVSHTHKGSWGTGAVGNNFQNSVVKVSYASNERPNQWKAHGKYLEREGAQNEGKKGLGFGKDLDDLKISMELDKWQKAGDERIFKIIASPEQAERLDIKEHVRMMMKKMEKDFGIKLEWVAIDHHNTENKHAHIVIRGIDEKGEALTISKNYIQKGIRFRSREAATQKLGIRLKDDILSQRQKAVEQKRVTALDRELMRMKDGSYKITLEKPARTNYQADKSIHLIGRLQFLTSMGFAEKIGNLTWQVKEDLLEGLKVYQHTQDIIKRKAQHMSNITDSRLPLSYTVLKEGEQVVGRVVGFGLDNEQFDKRYMLIEGADGIVHYMKPSKNVIRDRDALKIENNDVVLVEGKVFVKDGEKIPYIVVKNFEKLETIKEVSLLTDMDKFLINDVSKEQKLSVSTQNSKTFQEKFLNFRQERIQNMQRLGLLDKNLVIKKDDLRNRKKQDRGRRL